VILQGLVNYYDRLESTGKVAPPGYSAEKISFAIGLDLNGRVNDVDDLRDHSGRKPRPKVLFVPRPVKRTSGMAANFLWDKTAYVFGRATDSKRCDQEHATFVAFHRTLLEKTNDDGLRAFLIFLENSTSANFDSLRYADDLIDQNVVFRLDGERSYLHERSAAKAIWGRHLASSAADTEICLVTGGRAPIARLHPAIKGVPGAQSSGASIVSFNLDAFTSYGKEQGANAPVSESAAHGYATALNALLSQNNGIDAKTNRPKWTNRVQIGDATTVFWAEAAAGPQGAARAEKAESLFAMLLEPPTDEQEAAKLQGLFQKIEQSRPLADIDPDLDPATRFYVLGLSPNAARLSVRFFLSSTLGELVAHSVEHHRDLAIEPSAWTAPPTAWHLLRETAAQGEADNVSPALAGEVARAVLTGGRYPRSLLSQAIMRARADGRIDGHRAAIAKAYIARAHRKDVEQNSPDPEEDISVALDRNETNPGYRLGRLFYVLENAQRLGIGRVNATIRDKFYASASANPARVFPLLLRGAQDHIGAVRRKSGGGLAYWLDQQIAEIIGGLTAAAPFPSTLRLEDQGRFVVGYYHQRNAAKSEGKDAEDLPDTDEEE
jgi:CRISPR-associated protein Csd1